MPPRLPRGGPNRKPWEAAIARNRHLDRALKGPPATARWVTGLIVLIGLGVVWWGFFAGDRGRERALRPLAPGVDSAAVVAALGAHPPACETGPLEHLRGQLPDDTPPATVESTLERLRRETAARWVYPAEGDPVGCTPAEGATEIGLDRAGRVLWIVPAVGREPLVAPEP